MSESIDKYASVQLVISELGRHGVDGSLWHTGGGCTSVEVEVKHDDPAIETAYVSVTNGNSTVCLTEEDRERFTGWLVLYYANEDAMLNGEPFEIVHGDEVWKSATSAVVDWRADTVAMARAIEEFIANLRK
jgi:hypothetical protein